MVKAARLGAARLLDVGAALGVCSSLGFIFLGATAGPKAVSKMAIAPTITHPSKRII